MKRIFTLCVTVCLVMTGFAQTDTTGQRRTTNDTIRIGGLIIVRKPGSQNRQPGKDYQTRSRRRPSNRNINWFVLDLGFSNYNDKSNYTTAVTSGFISPTVSEDDLKAKTWKSRNVNVWFFMQKLNIANHVLNFKYGLGLELNNYSFDNTNLTFDKNPTFISKVAMSEVKKSKLAADYLTLPVMLNVNFTPNRRRSYGFSAGVSAGYLYSSRFKTKGGGEIRKLKDDFNLEAFKLSYVGELALGRIHLYGSYAMKNMWEKGLDMSPYNFGFRFSKL